MDSNNSNILVNDEELNVLARQLLAKYKNTLADNGVNASGNLYSSANYYITVEGTKFQVWFNLADYWYYVENGRKPGRFPPIDKIREWITIKPVIPRAGSNGKIPSTDQLVFLISRKIAEKGIDARFPLAKTLENNNAIIDQMIDRIANLLDIEIDKELEKL